MPCASSVSDTSIVPSPTLTANYELHRTRTHQADARGRGLIAPSDLCRAEANDKSPILTPQAA